MNEESQVNVEAIESASASDPDAGVNVTADPKAAEGETVERNEYICLLESELEAKIEEAEKTRANFEKKLTELTGREREFHEIGRAHV